MLVNDDVYFINKFAYMIHSPLLKRLNNRMYGFSVDKHYRRHYPHIFFQHGIYAKMYVDLVAFHRLHYRDHHFAATINENQQTSM